MPVYLPEIKGERAGLYVLSPNLNRSLFKIGISQSIKKRMNSYHICFPEGFYIHAIILFKDNIKIPTIKKKNNEPYKNQLGAYLKMYENLLTSEIKNKGGVNVNVLGDRVKARNLESEWFNVDLQVMKNAFKQFYKENPYDFIRPMLKFKQN
jgi:hypothetical protein